MSWFYRPDEIMVVKSQGAPTVARDTPTLNVDVTTGALSLNPGAGSTTYTTTGTANFESLTAARVLTMADSGKTFWLNLAGGFDVTLPALATSAGFRAEFIVGTIPTTAYTVTGATADKISGYVLSASGGAETANVAGDVVNFVANTAALGDRLRVDCNGLIYVARGECAVAGGVTITG